MQAADDEDDGSGSGREGGSRLSLALINRLDEVPRLNAAIEQFGSNHRLPLTTIDDINIALDELVTNIIRYGYNDTDAHQILVRLKLEFGCLTVDIIDDGRAFNPLDRPPPDLTSPIEERPVGGLGIHFVRTLMDEVSYRRDGNSNAFRMVKRVTPDS